MAKMYDYLIVGGGLFGAVFAREAAAAGRSVLIVDRRTHVGGNVHTSATEGIPTHCYGPHLFHSNSKRIWDYVNRFAEFNNYQHKVKATYGDKVFSLPFNLNTYYELWGCKTPEEAKRHLDAQKVKIEKPANLEEWALSQVGPDIYQTLIYGYTKKQWNREPRTLPVSIIKRLPLRLTFNDNYFDDPHQGVPVRGYAHLIENLLDGVEIKLGVDYLSDKATLNNLAEKVVYSGAIDELFDYRHGMLEYRSLRFEHKVVDGDFQGIGQMNYTAEDVPYTRIVEHKHFHSIKSDKSVITYEYPDEWGPGKIPYYPVGDEKNTAIFELYRKETASHPNLLIGGRLGKFQYFNMDQVVGNALAVAKSELLGLEATPVAV